MRLLLLGLLLSACGESTPEVPSPEPAVAPAVTPAEPVGCSLTATPASVPDVPMDPDWQPPHPGTRDRRRIDLPAGTATVWVEREDATVRLLLQRGEAEPLVVDAVTTTADHAAQSARSLFDRAAAPHASGVAVAWRPLVDGTPGHERDAELRWRVVDEHGPGPLHAEALTAPLLGATTGLGPHAYGASRLVAGSVDGNPVFVWQGDTSIRAVVADSDAPIDVPGRSSAELRLRSGEHAELTGLDYWCADTPDTHSSSCRSVEQSVLRCAGS